MYQHLQGTRVVELSAFVAAPLAGMTLAQMGCDVIRVDPPRGGLDAHRWPIDKDGRSIFWRGLNKAKRSLAVDLRRPEGVELVSALACSTDAGNGILLTNLPQPAALTYEGLRERRPDAIHAEVRGYADGASAVDYTIAARSGVPWLAGPADLDAPVNSPLPAWDVITGMNAALAIVLAVRRRELTGEGARIRVALADVAMSVLSSLGLVDEEELAIEPRRRDGNYLYGAFGRDFLLRDGSRVMIVAITVKQWRALVDALGISAEVEDLERATGLDLSEEGSRYAQREAIAALVETWCATRDRVEVAEVFDRCRVCWGPYETAAEFAAAWSRSAASSGMVGAHDGQGSDGSLVDSALRFDSIPSVSLRGAPTLGAHTEEVLAELLGLTTHEIGTLAAAGVVRLGDGRGGAD